MIQAIVAAAEAEWAPVIIQTTPGTLRHADPAMFRAMAAAAAAASGCPVAIHLDHGEDLPSIERAVAAGYTSVMIDGSKEALEENAVLTRAAVDLAGRAGVPVEGELGRFGGKEDDLGDGGCGYTNPDEAEIFVETTRVGSLAVGVGTAHGVYASAPRLRIDLIATLRGRIGVPLVLHGASGLPESVIRECVAAGVAKVNFATDLRLAFTKAVKETLRDRPQAWDPKIYGAAGREAVKLLVRSLIRTVGASGRAERPPEEIPPEEIPPPPPRPLTPPPFSGPDWSGSDGPVAGALGGPGDGARKESHRGTNHQEAIPPGTNLTGANRQTKGGDR